MLHIEPLTIDIIERLNQEKSLEILNELSPDDRNLFLSKSIFVSADDDTLVNPPFIPAKGLELLDEIASGASTIQGELYIPFTLIGGSMSFNVPHQTSKIDNLANLIQAPFFTFVIPFAHGNMDVQASVTLKKESISLITDPSTYFSICNRYPSLWMRIFQCRNRLITILINQYRVFASVNSDLRVAQLLHALSYSEGLLHNEVTVNTSQHDIADILSLSRASVAKSLAKLYDHEVAKPGYRTITVYSSQLVKYINNYDGQQRDTN